MAFSPLPPLDDLTVREWSELTSTTGKCVEFCQRIGLLHVSPKETCTQGHNNWYLGSSSRSLDKCQWRCRSCKSTRTLRDGTFFSHSRLELQQILDLMLYWSQGVDSQKFIRRNCKILSSATIVDWRNFMRDLCSEYFIRNPATIGGTGHVVEIDESAWTKRKYNRGRLVKNQWVFGGIDRDTRECFAVLVDQRNAATLLPIIDQFILPGTTIYSDEWAAYNNIVNSPNNYTHGTVNHSRNFVDPTTLVHTQNIENLWMVAKMKKKREMGQHVSLLDSHLTEFMWRRRFGQRPFENIVRMIQQIYPLV